MPVAKGLAVVLASSAGVLLAQVVPGHSVIDDDVRALVTWLLLAMVALVGWFLRGTLSDLKRSIDKVDHKVDAFGLRLDASQSRLGAQDLTIAHLESRIVAVEVLTRVLDRKSQ